MSSLETMDFGKIFMRQGILIGYFLCDRVQGVESFATHTRHFPSQVPPPGGIAALKKLKTVVPQSQLCNVYYAIIESHLRYADVILGSLSKTN